MHGAYLIDERGQAQCSPGEIVGISLDADASAYGECPHRKSTLMESGFSICDGGAPSFGSLLFRQKTAQLSQLRGVTPTSAADQTRKLLYHRRFSRDQWR